MGLFDGQVVGFCVDPVLIVEFLGVVAGLFEAGHLLA